MLKICFYCSRDDYYPTPALGISYIASYLIRMRLVDKNNILIADSFEEVIGFKPNVVGISSTSQVFKQAKEFAAKCREHFDSFIVLGGYHISMLPSSLPKEFDAGVIGEGEITFAELIIALSNNSYGEDDLKTINGICYHTSNGVQVNKKRALIKQLDALPYPLFQKRYSDQYPLFTSRGCPYKCTFCASPLFWEGRIRFRTAESVVNEIMYAVNDHNYKEIYILDDLWIADKKRFKEIVESLEEKKIPERINFQGFSRSNIITEEDIKLLKRLNYSMVRFGGETASNELLQKIKGKNISIKDHQKVIDLCAKFELPCSASFMFGIPGETQADLDMTRKFLIKNRGRFTISGFYYFNPIPGTALWQNIVEEGKIGDDFDLSELQLDLLKKNFSWEKAKEAYFNNENIPFNVFKQEVETIKSNTFEWEPSISNAIRDIATLSTNDRLFYFKNNLPKYLKVKIHFIIMFILKKTNEAMFESIKTLLFHLGYRVSLQKIGPKLEKNKKSKKMKGKKIYVGCGEDVKNGYIGCDIRKLKNVNIVCRAWELSQYCEEAIEIYSRHMLEHLTFGEMAASLIDWHKVLATGGKIKIIVPNMEFHINQWEKAIWTEETYKSDRSDACWAIAGFWGWQRQCDPAYNNYEETYWDVHKSGYNKNNLYFFLKRAGFEAIKIYVKDDVHLVAEAQK